MPRRNCQTGLADPRPARGALNTLVDIPDENPLLRALSSDTHQCLAITWGAGRAGVFSLQFV
jgi:hypothetical protein